MFLIGNGIIKTTGFAFMIVIQNSRGNRLYNVKFWKHMKDWHICMILLGVYYQVENPFPIPRGNGIINRTDFALIIVIQKS